MHLCQHQINPNHGNSSKSLTSQKNMTTKFYLSFKPHIPWCRLIKQLGRHFHGLPTWHQCKHQPEHTVMFSLEYEKYSRKAHGFPSEFHVNSPGNLSSLKLKKSSSDPLNFQLPLQGHQVPFSKPSAKRTGLPWPHPL